MLRTIPTMAVLAWGAMLTGCAAETTTTLDTTAPGAPAASAEAPQPFEVSLGGDATAETAIPAILAAGRDQLAAVCEQAPEAAIRVWNPLAPGASADIACSSVIAGTGQASESLTSRDDDGPTGTVQQKWSPFGLACSALVLGATLAWNWPWGEEGCNARGAENPTGCRAVTTLGGGGLGLLCAFI